jgi:hypothetical protein
VNGTILGTVSIFSVTLGTASPPVALVVTAGSVTVNSTLRVGLSSRFTPAVSETFTLIKNETGTTINGIFAGLAEGSTFTVNGMTFRISYLGGGGNDMVITRTA